MHMRYSYVKISLRRLASFEGTSPKAHKLDCLMDYSTQQGAPDAACKKPEPFRLAHTGHCGVVLPSCRPAQDSAIEASSWLYTLHGLPKPRVRIQGSTPATAGLKFNLSCCRGSYFEHEHENADCTGTSQTLRIFMTMLWVPSLCINPL